MDTNTAWTLVDLALMILTPIAGWAGLKLSKWIGTLEANAKTGGMLARLTDSIFVAVQTVNATTKAKILAAKQPGSPGGVKITEDEAAELKRAAWAEIKAYWGSKGLETAGKVIGLGDVTRFVDGKIEAAIEDLKRDPQ